ncbi:unnamed protein product, partial [Gulo gulo]
MMVVSNAITDGSSVSSDRNPSKIWHSVKHAEKTVMTSSR